MTWTPAFLLEQLLLSSSPWTEPAASNPRGRCQSSSVAEMAAATRDGEFQLLADKRSRPPRMSNLEGESSSGSFAHFVTGRYAVRWLSLASRAGLAGRLAERVAEGAVRAEGARAVRIELSRALSPRHPCTSCPVRTPSKKRHGPLQRSPRTTRCPGFRSLSRRSCHRRASAPACRRKYGS